MNNSPKPEKLQINSTSSKADRLKQIDALYRSQIKQIYKESQEKVKEKEKTKQKSKQVQVKREKSPSIYTGLKKIGSNQNILQDGYSKQTRDEQRIAKVYKSTDSQSRISKIQTSIMSAEKKYEDERVRASVYLQGQSTRTIEILRKQNQLKQLKIRELATKCENLIQKLRTHLPQAQFSKQLQNLKQFSDTKMQRLQNLFKIKNEQIFFKMKLQIIGLLQQFQVSKQQISGINEVNNQSALYSFMVRKLKLKLKDFRSKQQESNFQIQKDKILNQKYEERIHYLMETNQLLKLSQTKLKNKIEDLRSQMNQFLDKFKLKQKQIQQRQSQIFRLKKQNQQLQANNQKLSHIQRNISSQRNDEKRIYQAKQKQMKALLGSYFLERKKLEGLLEQKQGQLQQIRIQLKFIQQQNERINREYVRWKQRYQWLEKQKQNRQRQYEQEKAQLLSEFMEYKNQNNQGVYLSCKAETDEALRKVQQYQAAYQKLISEIQQQRRIRILKQEQAREIHQINEREWVEKIKRIQKLKQQQMYEQAADHQNRQIQIRQQYQKRQQLLAEQMQARMKALLAENDKKATEKMIQLQNQNDELRRQIQNLNKVVEIKQSLINNVIKSTQ